MDFNKSETKASTANWFDQTYEMLIVNFNIGSECWTAGKPRRVSLLSSLFVEYALN